MFDSLTSAFGSQPEIRRSLAEHVRTVMQTGSVPRLTKELCATMVSWLNACVACAKSHEALAQHVGVEREVLEDLENYATSPKYSDAQRAALSAAIALTREPRALPPAVRDALRAHYTDGEIAEIVAVVGLYNSVNRMHNALIAPTPDSQGCEPLPLQP